MADDTRPVFLYATGTAFVPTVIYADGKLRLDYLPIGEGGPTLYVPGINGRIAPFTGGITNDPFPVLMNPDLWEAIKVPYPASAFPMDQSIQTGVDWIIDYVNNKMAAGRPWAVGGQSQGAAVASRIYKHLQNGTAFDSTRANAFLTGVCFGNPMRQTNFTNPWSSYSGAFDVPGSTTGGHGVFPAAYRLTNCNPSTWIEFTNPAEVVTGVGDSPLGTWWQAAAGAFLGQTIITPGAPGSFLFNFTTFLLGVGAQLLTGGLNFEVGFLSQLNNATNPASAGYFGPGPVTDPTGTTIQLPGGGHTVYAALPPTGYAGTETSYQLALGYLDSLALQTATSPSVLPPTSSVAGWSTTLLPPAA